MDPLLAQPGLMLGFGLLLLRRGFLLAGSIIGGGQPRMNHVHGHVSILLEISLA
jgi:hypothetical protein